MTSEEIHNKALKIMVHAINEAMRTGAISMCTLHQKRRERKRGVIMLTVCSCPTLFSWDQDRHGIMRLTCWWDFNVDSLSAPYLREKIDDMNRVLPCNDRSRFRFIMGGAASCYFDNQINRGLIAKLNKLVFGVYVRESSVSQIDSIEEAKPMGYKVPWDGNLELLAGLRLVNGRYC